MLTIFSELVEGVVAKYYDATLKYILRSTAVAYTVVCKTLEGGGKFIRHGVCKMISRVRFVLT